MRAADVDLVDILIRPGAVLFPAPKKVFLPPSVPLRKIRFAEQHPSEVSTRVTTVRRSVFAAVDRHARHETARKNGVSCDRDLVFLGFLPVSWLAFSAESSLIITFPLQTEL